MRRVAIATPEITLASFLKWARVTPTGGQARRLLRSTAVTVNGVPEARRGRRLRPGDVVRIGDQEEIAIVAPDGD